MYLYKTKEKKSKIKKETHSKQKSGGSFRIPAFPFAHCREVLKIKEQCLKHFLDLQFWQEKQSYGEINKKPSSICIEIKIATNKH